MSKQDTDDTLEFQTAFNLLNDKRHVFLYDSSDARNAWQTLIKPSHVLSVVKGV